MNFSTDFPRRIRHFIRFILPALLLAGCDYDRFGELPAEESPVMNANTTLASVERFYRNGGVDFPDGTVVSGTVTTSDSAENFYKMLVIQQEETPLAVLTGTYDTYSAYRPGGRIAVRLDGLRVGLWDGMLAVGAPEPEYTEGIDYIASDAVLRKIIARMDGSEPVDTLETSIAGISSALAGRLVRLSDVFFTQGGRHTWSGEQTLSDAGGRTLRTYTSPYASFADDLLPEGRISLTGIVTVYRDVVQLKVSSADDAVPATGRY